MIADITTNKTFQVAIKELLIRFRKLNISLPFTHTHCIYDFSIPTEVRLNSTNHLIKKIHNKEELQLLLIIQQILIINIL